MTLGSVGFIHAPVGWTIRNLFTGIGEPVSDCAGGATPPPASGKRLSKVGSNQHPRQVLLVSFARHWSGRPQRMDCRLIFLSVSYGRKVASTRSRSARRALRALRNSCHRPRIGAGAEVLKSRAESLQREIDRLVGPASSAGTEHRRGPRKGRKVAPKYLGPNGEKWSGRGLKPRWLTTAISKGKRLDDFLIDPPKNNHASEARH
jgi:DNA-binding protein H-NS